MPFKPSVAVLLTVAAFLGSACTEGVIGTGPRVRVLEDGESVDTEAGRLDGVEPDPGDRPGEGGGPPAGGEVTDPDVPGCGSVEAAGQCDGTVARWCQAGVLETQDCVATGDVCRWVDDRGANRCAPAEEEPVGVECADPIVVSELGLTNGARQAAGLTPLACDEALSRAARLHSQDMCDQGYFSHASLDGRSFVDRIVAQGATYRTAGENIARGQRTPDEVHDAWMDSSGHRANILGAGYGRIGIGYVACGGRHYWTQDFTD
jgi:hypothetical protein